jgi:hypothetical protein
MSTNGDVNRPYIAWVRSVPVLTESITKYTARCISIRSHFEPQTHHFKMLPPTGRYIIEYHIINRTRVSYVVKAEF